MKVRFYLHKHDYTGTVVNVKEIKINPNGGGTVKTESGENFDLYSEFVMEEPCKIKVDIYSGFTVISPVD